MICIMVQKKNKERRKQTDRKKGKRVEAPQGIYSFLTAFHILIVRAAHIIFIRECPQFIYFFFFFGHLPDAHTNAYTIERIIYISFFCRFNFGFFSSSIWFWFRVWDSPVDSTQNVIIKLNIASITHPQLILVSCFIFSPSFAAFFVHNSLLSFSFDRYNVGDLLCFQMMRKKTCVFCIKQEFHPLCCDRFHFISLEIFIKCRFYDDEKS